MAKITRSQAEQITNAYKDMLQISAQYPNVKASESINDTICTIVEYFTSINVYVSMDGLATRINCVVRCEIYDNMLIIEGTQGYVRIYISYE